MFISLSSTCIQNFSNWHALFVCLFCFFLSHSVAVAAWSRIQGVDPQMIHFELFNHLVRRSQFNPQTIFVCHSKAFVLLYKFKKSWALLGRLSRGFFCHLRSL